MDTAKKTLVIGLVGKAGSGKDTAFQVLKQLLEKKVVARIAFGDEVKLEYSTASNTPVEELNLNKSEYREELQHWGTEFRRSQEEDYWINKIRIQADVLCGLADVVVFTDVRFMNERDYIKNDLDGYIIRVEPPKTFRLGKHHSHASEEEQDDIIVDYVLPNNTEGFEGLASYWSIIIEEIKDDKRFTKS